MVHTVSLTETLAVLVLVLAAASFALHLRSWLARTRRARTLPWCGAIGKGAGLEIHANDIKIIIGIEIHAGWSDLSFKHA